MAKRNTGGNNIIGNKANNAATNREDSDSRAVVTGFDLPVSSGVTYSYCCSMVTPIKRLSECPVSTMPIKNR